MGHAGVQHVAVVGDDHDGTLIIVDQFFEIGLARHVEVVIRLVEQQHRWFCQQQARQPDQFFLPSTQGTDGLVEIGLGQSQSAQQPPNARIIILPAQRLEFLQQDMLGIQGPFQCFGIVIHVGVTQFCFQARQFAIDLRHARVALQRQRDGRSVRIELGMLGQVTKGDPPGLDDCAAFLRGVLAGDQLQKGRFPGPVGTDQTDLLVMLDLPAQVAKDGMGAKDQGGI